MISYGLYFMTYILRTEKLSPVPVNKNILSHKDDFIYVVKILSYFCIFFFVLVLFCLFFVLLKQDNFSEAYLERCE